MRFDVITTAGGVSARTVPISGIVIAKSASTSMQERLELVVGAVELVDQEHRARALADRPKQWPLDEELLAEKLGGPPLRIGRAVLDRASMQQLPGVVPLVQRLARVDALVALQADQLGAERSGERPRGLRLPDAGLALEQEGAVHGEREVHSRRKALVAEVVGTGPGGRRDRRVRPRSRAKA